MLALELAGLSGLAFAAPVLEALGRSPESLIALDAGPGDIVVFALVVALGPALALAAIGAVARLGGRGLRQVLHLDLVGVLAGLVAWRLAADATAWSVTPLVVTGLVAGALVGVLRHRLPSARTFLRFAAVAPVVFVAQFLAFSPAAALVWHRAVPVDAEAAAATASLAESGPPVVVVVLDALPTAALLDGTGHIDAELYPALAGLADEASWYRNHTTVAPSTLDAVPALLTGRYPTGTAGPTAVDHPHNLFTLLGGSYDLSVHEEVTFLCPDTLCPRPEVFAVDDLLSTGRDLWRDKLTRREAGVASFIPRATDSRRHGRYAALIAGEDHSPGDRPGLFFYHLMFPHEPFEFLPDGSLYAGSHPPRGLFAGRWARTGMDVARQRFVLQLQAADRQLGDLFASLRAAGTYDDALIVVTADHGNSFEPDEPWRGVSEGNLAEIMWTPLIIKAPGQAGGRIADTNVSSIDVLPTIADILGVDLPWEVDGRPVDDVDGRHPWRKHIAAWELNDLEPPPGEHLLAVDGRVPFRRVLAADWVPGGGPDAVWQRGVHDDLLGRPVAELTIGSPAADLRLEVDGLEQWDDVDLHTWPPLEIGGVAWASPDSAVAIGLNGVVAAVVPPEPTPFGISSVHALVLPEARRPGRNEVTAYLVEDAPGGPVLHEMEVVAKDG